MADDKKGEAAEAVEPKPLTTMKLLILLIVSSLVGGTASVGAMLAFMPEAPGVAVADGEHGGSEGHGGGDGHGGGSEDGHGGGDDGHGDSTAHDGGVASHDGGPGASEVLNLAAFVVNLSDTNRERFMKTTIKLEFANDNLLNEAKENPAKLALIRHSILLTLAAKNSTELKTVDGKAQLQYDIKHAVSEALELNPRAIRRVFFNEFVIQ